jgi:hypothetical protein
MVVPQQTTEPFSTSNRLLARGPGELPKQQNIVFALMITLGVEVRNIFGERSPQCALTE